MPSPTTERSVVEVPDAAVDKFVLELFGFHEERLIGKAGEEEQRREIRRMLRHVTPSLEESFKERAREALLGDEVRNALYDAHMHYQARAPQEQSEDGWLTALLTAVADAALKPNGAEEAEQS